VNPRHDPDQGALAGAVLAEERVHFSAAQLVVDAVEDCDPREGLGDADGRVRRVALR
jgi:hypothetical protein